MMIETLRRYFLVTKPRVVIGNLISVAGGYFLAAGGRADAGLLLWTMAGAGLVISSGCVFNNCIDRDIDRKMRRTRQRILARRLMSPTAAVIYGIILGLTGMGLLISCVNELCAFVVAAGWFIYVAVYSQMLKRRSVHAALIGSLAGAAPPLAGYCAAAGRLDLGGLILLAIFSLWQMPHAFAIAVSRLDDYKAADIPVLPAQRGIRVARQQTVFYILAFILAALSLWAAGYTGQRYLTVIVAIGLVWLSMAVWGYRKGQERRWARRLFICSIINISILCIMMAIDIPPTRFTTSALFHENKLTAETADPGSSQGSKRSAQRFLTCKSVSL